MMEENKTVLQLSQGNLQDFSECPRRFQLKVIDNISWPAAYSEPLSQLEKATDIGNKFHQLCHQLFTGIDKDSLSHTLSNPDLKIMWDDFISFAKDLQDDNRFSEIILSTPFLGHQLIAKYDLVIRTNNGKYIIYDWKTSSQKPTRTFLSQRYQTFLYPYILVETGSSIFHTEQISPKNISMNYWYPMSSDPEEIFPYSEIAYSENTTHLTDIISKIDGFVDSEKLFPLTENRKLCGKCVYRSLCERGIQASKLDPFTEIDAEDLSGVHFDFGNISEIEF